MASDNDTICAAATPAGRGGVAVVRVSGSRSLQLCKTLTGRSPRPREAHYTQFRNAAGQLIDVGLTLFFAAPRSFTGEDVCEFHVHGSPVVIDQLLSALVSAGARLARPGEFSLRAFLNDKLDLVQAEAIADLIDSTSTAAARKALASLQGEFSRLIHALVASITNLRVFVEAAIDFPEEEVDFLGTSDFDARLAAIRSQLAAVIDEARQGLILKEGIQVVIAGEPNAGKSTLLNALAGLEAAIVTDIPGTTRDVLRHELSISGVPLHVADTAGLRHSDDPVEREGIRRARQAIDAADLILFVCDARQAAELGHNSVWQEFLRHDLARQRLTLVLNKTDLVDLEPGTGLIDGVRSIRLSAKHGHGLDLLRSHLLERAGFMPQEEGGFIARRRHLDALRRAGDALERAEEQFVVHRSGELVAEELRRAQQALGEITGVVTADDLLGAIFSSFCIGK